MKLATLVYIKQDGQTLMVHRNKKPGDMHAGKWNGLGGKLEPGETPEACAVREVWEESGLTIRAPRLHGLLTFPAFSQGEDWYAFVFTAHDFRGDLIDSPEGRLEWVEDDRLLDLPLWEGDRIFIPWLAGEAFFSGRFVYVEGRLTEWDAVFYGERAVQHSTAAYGPPAASNVQREAAPAAAFVPVYRPEDDTYCWVCGGAVVERHCKIICAECGFTRDCGDP